MYSEDMYMCNVWNTIAELFSKDPEYVGVLYSQIQMCFYSKGKTLGM
jgi:hypothetical protein